MKKSILNYIIKNLKKDDPLEKVFLPAVKDGKFVSPVINPKEGGTFTNFKGGKFLYPGWPRDKELHLVGAIKGLIPMGLGIVDKVVETIDKKPKEWCKTAREMYRVFNIMIEREEGEDYKKRWSQVRDAICLILEHDDAYRFRFQDAFSELNPEEFKLTKADKYWFSRMGYEFPGKKEFLEKHGDPITHYQKMLEEEQKQRKNIDEQSKK